MSDNSKPIATDSKERVAYNLMALIAEAEAIKDGGVSIAVDPRRYYFKLYGQALKMVHGEGLEYALK